ncbi:MAG: 4Fe-4S binding protein [Anaerolineales bacterium]|nr:4Fe-4S binding protein [Anaerolineales bacterium]
MGINKIRLVYFSPTGTTRTILENIASGIGIEQFDCVDFTLYDAFPKVIDHFMNELVIIGAPVYSGRLPVVAVNRFKMLKADNIPAVIVVLYGNRAYDDALLELKDLAKELGFIPVAGGAFIGEHSFATRDLPIAMGRPDDRDLEMAKAFGEKVKNMITGIQSLDEIQVPGRYPYRNGKPSPPNSPVTKEDTCTKCEFCARVCPTNAISIGNTVSTDPDLCIFCCACIKICPTDARVMEEPSVLNITRMLNKDFSSRKDPEIFMSQVY